MKTKSKVLTAVLVCIALVVAFTACAGCTGTDPIVGIWIQEDTTYGYVFEIESDGILTSLCVENMEKPADQRYADSQSIAYGKWVNNGNNYYSIIFTSEGMVLSASVDGDVLSLSSQNSIEPMILKKDNSFTYVSKS